MPDKDIENANKRFFDIWAKCYDNPVFGFLRVIQRRALKEVKGNKISILDIGCGTGWSLEWLKKKVPNARLSGIDISKKMLAKAKSRLATKAILKQASAGKIPFKSNSFDYVLCTSAFHHFPEQLNALKEMKRVLKNDGKLLLADEDFFLLNKIIKKIEPGHVKMNSKKEIKELIEKAGLKIIKQKRIFLFVIVNVCIKKYKYSDLLNKK